MQEAVITGGTLEAPGKAEGLPPAQFPVTPDDLKRRRDELREEYQRLAEAQRKLSAAEDREKQALQAISELSSSESRGSKRMGSAGGLCRRNAAA
jgi:hypothetical protein